MSKGPVCNCGECYREWAKDEIERLEEIIADCIKDVTHYHNELNAAIQYAAKLEKELGR